MTDLTYRYVALTDVGLRRSNNEDSGFASPHLLAIADGMGGAAAGDLASSSAMHVLRRLDRELEVDALAALEQTVQSANDRLGELIRDDPAVEGMGTTLEAMLWDGEKLAVAHLGDSRMYRLRDHYLSQVSTDHTFVQSLVDEGKLTPAEARVHPHRSLLLRAMLGRDDNEADFSWIQPMRGDRYLLCSDGLSDMVTDENIERALQAESIDLAATDLVRMALEAGGHDNVTVVISEFVDADEEADETLSSADRQPQLVGAAAEQYRPATDDVDAESVDAADRQVVGEGSPAIVAPDGEFDEEAMRYAPREPRRFTWLRRAALLVVILAIVGGAGYGAYQWSQTQYFVAASDDGRVAIYRGVQADIPGLSLSSVADVSSIDLDSLPAYSRSQVEDGIDAADRADAEEIVANLDQFVQPEPEPTDQPTDESTDEPTAGEADA